MRLCFYGSRNKGSDEDDDTAEISSHDTTDKFFSALEVRDFILG